MNFKNALTPSEVGNYLIRFYEAAAQKGLKVGESDVVIQAESLEGGDGFGALFFMHGDHKIYVCPAWDEAVSFHYMTRIAWYVGDNTGVGCYKCKADLDERLLTMSSYGFAPTYITIQLNGIEKLTKIPFMLEFDLKKDLKAFRDRVSQIESIDFFPREVMCEKLLVRMKGHVYQFGDIGDN
jgi:hypothetical protein